MYESYGQGWFRGWSEVRLMTFSPSER